jgi:hypothetical protein
MSLLTALAIEVMPVLLGGGVAVLLGLCSTRRASTAWHADDKQVEKILRMGGRRVPHSCLIKIQPTVREKRPCN